MRPRSRARTQASTSSRLPLVPTQVDDRRHSAARVGSTRDVDLAVEPIEIEGHRLVDVAVGIQIREVRGDERIVACVDAAGEQRQMIIVVDNCVWVTVRTARVDERWLEKDVS